MWRVVAIGTALLIVGVAIALLAGGLSWIKARFYIDHMENPGRLERMQVERVVETLKLVPGSAVADIGAGSGLFTRTMAKVVAPGVVYAVDINPNLLTHIEKSAKQAGLANDWPVCFNSIPYPLVPAGTSLRVFTHRSAVFLGVISSISLVLKWIKQVQFICIYNDYLEYGFSIGKGMER